MAIEVFRNVQMFPNGSVVETHGTVAALDAQGNASGPITPTVKITQGPGAAMPIGVDPAGAALVLNTTPIAVPDAGLA